MNTIRTKIIMLSTGNGLGFIIFLCLLFQDANAVPFIKETDILVTILLQVVLAFFLIRTIRNFKIAKLIMENRILHIQSSKTESFISCFGMLLNTKIIKFNLDHIHLIKVEIGERYIDMTYGTDKKIEKTRILHDELSSNELDSIITKFRYETGITPVVLIEGKEGI